MDLYQLAAQVRLKIKIMIVQAAAMELIPAKLAKLIIRMGGLRHV